MGLTPVWESKSEQTAELMGKLVGKQIDLGRLLAIAEQAELAQAAARRRSRGKKQVID